LGVLRALSTPPAMVTTVKPTSFHSGVREDILAKLIQNCCLLGDLKRLISILENIVLAVTLMLPRGSNSIDFLGAVVEIKLDR
jgi:hypothetical protein